MLWPALDAIRFKTFGLSVGTAEAFGFKNKKSAPCCLRFGVLLLLVDDAGQSCLSLADCSAMTTGIKWFGVYQVPALLSKLLSLDHRMFMASSLGMTEVSDSPGPASAWMASFSSSGIPDIL